MADASDSSLAFYSKATATQWSYVLGLYKDVLRVKAASRTKKGGPEELIKLDTWFQETLPKIIHSRKDPHVIHEELVQITRWKLMRGKFRPRLLDLVRINTETAVFQTTKKAFRKLSHGNNLSQAITALTTLKGIGPATASAVLVAAYPEHAPFMADESMLATPGVEATDYTLAEYMNYAEQIKSCTERLKNDDPDVKWTPHKVEMALWTHYLARELNPSLLEGMPKAGDRPSLKCDQSSAEDADEESDVTHHHVEEHNIISSTTPSANGKESIDDNSNLSASLDGDNKFNDSLSMATSRNGNNGNGTVSADDSKDLSEDSHNHRPDFHNDRDHSDQSLVHGMATIIDRINPVTGVINNDSNDNAVDGVEEPAFKKQRTCVNEITSVSGGHTEIKSDIIAADMITAPTAPAAVQL